MLHVKGSGLTEAKHSREKQPVTPDTALRLERVLGMSAEFWLGLQQGWDLWGAMHSDRAAEIARLKPLRRHSA